MAVQRAENSAGAASVQIWVMVDFHSHPARPVIYEQRFSKPRVGGAYGGEIRDRERE